MASRPYKLRKSWEDTTSQLGTYTKLEAAQSAADAAAANGNFDYKVFFEGELVYDPLKVYEDEADFVDEMIDIDESQGHKDDSCYNEEVDLENLPEDGGKPKSWISKIFGAK